MKTFLLSFSVLLSSSLFAQGLSTSILLPKGGSIGIPVSPISVRGVGLGESAGIESGLTFYSIPALRLTGLSFDTPKPLIGQSYTVLIPAELFFRVDLKTVVIKAMAGGFFNWKIASRLNHGNLDRALLQHENWKTATSTVQLDLKSGLGLMGGLELEWRVSRQFSITTECQYLYGAHKGSLTGTYSGGDELVFETKNLDERNLKSSMQGIELSLGVKMTGK